MADLLEPIVLEHLVAIASYCLATSCAIIMRCSVVALLCYFSVELCYLSSHAAQCNAL
jgi:hypothetical protein